MCYGHDGHSALCEAQHRAGLNREGGVARRGFLAGLGATAAAGALGLAGAGPASAAGGVAAQPAKGRPGRRKVPRGHISIQLYTLRSDLEKNYDRTLRYVADAGYVRVEQAGYYGRTARQLKRFHDRLGLRTTSAHEGLSEQRSALEQKIANAVTLGHSYVNVPYLASDDPEQWKRWAYQINSEAAAFQREGIAYGYHNHAHEFVALANGQRPWDIFMAELDPVNVHLEADLYWVWTGAIEGDDGADDPLQFVIDTINDAPLKVRQYHVKDRDESTGDMCDLGTGVVDFAAIFANHQVEEYIVENDTPDVTPRQSAEVGYDYLRELRF
jgi:sugar phosphate isomerase/epimerase